MPVNGHGSICNVKRKKHLRSRNWDERPSGDVKMATRSQNIEDLKRVAEAYGEIVPRTFRHSASFGKRIEYWIIGEMLKEGLDVYVPLVDDDAIDAVIRRKDGTFITVQIKARSKTVGDRAAALFAAIPHELRDNYWFIFYSERMDMKWIMTSKEFIHEAFQNKSGKNKDKRSIWFNGCKKDKTTGKPVEYCRQQFEKYIARDYARLKSNPQSLIPNPS
jgi:hypothetical protein